MTETPIERIRKSKAEYDAKVAAEAARKREAQRKAAEENSPKSRRTEARRRAEILAKGERHGQAWARGTATFEELKGLYRSNALNLCPHEQIGTAGKFGLKLPIMQWLKGDNDRDIFVVGMVNGAYHEFNKMMQEMKG